MSHPVGSSPCDTEAHVSHTIREWNAEHNQGTIPRAQYLAAYVPLLGEGADLCILRLAYDPMDPSKMAVGAAVLQYNSDGIGNNVRYNILDFDFFDNDTLVVVFRENGAAGHTTVATVGFSDLHYQELQSVSSVSDISREQLIEHAIADEGTWSQIAAVLMPIRRSYVLAGCISEVSLALNGRIGRRVACVLDRKEAILEVLDIEGETDEGSWDEEGEEE